MWKSSTRSSLHKASSFKHCNNWMHASCEQLEHQHCKCQHKPTNSTYNYCILMAHLFISCLHALIVTALEHHDLLFPLSWWDSTSSATALMQVLHPIMH